MVGSVGKNQGSRRGWMTVSSMSSRWNRFWRSDRNTSPTLLKAATRRPNSSRRLVPQADTEVARPRNEAMLSVRRIKNSMGAAVAVVDQYNGQGQAQQSAKVTDRPDRNRSRRPGPGWTAGR